MARPPKIKPGTDIETMVQAYFDHCESTKEVRELKSGDTRIRQEQPSMIGLAVWLDVSKSALYEYLNGNYNAEGYSKEEIEEYTQRLKDTLTRARDRIEMLTVERASNGDMDSKTAALLLSKYGYSVKTDVEHSGSMTVAWSGVDAAAADEWSK